MCLCVIEIVDGNAKMTLGMIWTIILRFAIQDISVEGSVVCVVVFVGTFPHASYSFGLLKRSLAHCLHLQLKTLFIDTVSQC